MKYLFACVVLALKSFFQVVVNVLLYILKDPKEEKGAFLLKAISRIGKPVP